jgi:hypothetical protein
LASAYVVLKKSNNTFGVDPNNLAYTLAQNYDGKGFQNIS